MRREDVVGQRRTHHLDYIGHEIDALSWRQRDRPNKKEPLDVGDAACKAEDSKAEVRPARRDSRGPGGRHGMQGSDSALGIFGGIFFGILWIEVVNYAGVRRDSLSDRSGVGGTI